MPPGAEEQGETENFSTLWNPVVTLPSLFIGFFRGTVALTRLGAKVCLPQDP